MTLDEFLTRLEYLAQAIDAVDEAARKDFKLASLLMNNNRQSLGRFGWRRLLGCQEAA